MESLDTREILKRHAASLWRSACKAWNVWNTRGYDSAGVALTAPGMDKVVVRKKAGRLKNLVEDIERKPMPLATVGIGHTRWATNGEPSDVNAHPHTSMDGKVAIIHNGIIENASQLRLDLQAEGYRFASATDTEVAAKLLGKIVDKIIADEGGRLVQGCAPYGPHA